MLKSIIIGTGEWKDWERWAEGTHQFDGAQVSGFFAGEILFEHGQEGPIAHCQNKAKLLQVPNSVCDDQTCIRANPLPLLTVFRTLHHLPAKVSKEEVTQGREP